VSRFECETSNLRTITAYSTPKFGVTLKIKTLYKYLKYNNPTPIWWKLLFPPDNGKS
jgi:hypothetical protein